MLYTDSYGRTRVFIIQCLMGMTSDWRIASDCKLKDGSRLEQPAAVGKSLFSNDDESKDILAKYKETLKGK
ncbi:hypothetical protein PS1_038143 [Malus domestica]